jgi:hypothetical protein
VQQESYRCGQEDNFHALLATHLGIFYDKNVHRVLHEQAGLLANLQDKLHNFQIHHRLSFALDKLFLAILSSVCVKMDSNLPIKKNH